MHMIGRLRRTTSAAWAALRLHRIAAESSQAAAPHPASPRSANPVVSAVFRITARSNRYPAWMRLFGPLLVVSLSFGLRWLLVDVSVHISPYTEFYPAVLLSGLLFGHGAGYVAVVFSALAAIGILATPHGLAWIDVPDHEGVLILFVLSGFVSAFLIEALQTALRRMQRYTERMAEANERLARSEAEKSMLLREVNHRFRNDLQRLSIAFNAQGRATRNEEVRAVMRAAEDRVIALGSVNGRLDAALAVGSTKEVETARFLNGLADDLRSAIIGSIPVRLCLHLEDHRLPVNRALALGLMMNELLTNAMKYAFPDDRDGVITVTFERQDDYYQFSFADNGVGYDPNQTKPQGSGLGKWFMRSLTFQLNGDVQFTSHPGHGTRCVLRFPA